MAEADHESDKVNLRLSNGIDPGRLVERPVWERLRPIPGRVKKLGLLGAVRAENRVKPTKAVARVHAANRSLNRRVACRSPSSSASE